jgi:hypothetical protein
MHIILSILPFASRETIEEMTTHAMDTLDADMLPALAPFVSTQFLADLVRRSDDLMSGRNMELLQQIIAFLPGDLVDELIQKGAANGLHWKKKGQTGRIRYNLDIDLGSMRKLQKIGEYIGDTVGSVFSNLGASLQSGAQGTPETASCSDGSKETEYPLMRIARKAVEQSNGKWLEDHYCNLDCEDGFADVAGGEDDGIFVLDDESVEEGLWIWSLKRVFYPVVGGFDGEEAYFLWRSSGLFHFSEDEVDWGRGLSPVCCCDCFLRYFLFHLVTF